MSNGALAEAQRFTQLASSLRKNVEDICFDVNNCALGTDRDDLLFPDGISLLTVKVDALLSYIQHMAFLCAHRMSGKSLADETGTTYVERLVKLRLLLEKMRPMEARLKNQVEKLLRAANAQKRETHVATEEHGEEFDAMDFRPNPETFAAQATAKRLADAQRADEQEAAVYRPPKVAPVVFDPDARQSRKSRSKERQPSRNAALLADLAAGMSSNPYETSTSGVGGGKAIGAAGSSRARALRRMEEFEEENFKRVSMSKRDAKRRRRDEQDVALGGLGLSADGKRIGGGVEEEFGDLLRGSERDTRRRKRGDGNDVYGLLEQRAKRPSTISRAQQNSERDGAEVIAGPASTHKFKKAMREQRRKSRK
ncbi:hypothetical protein MVES1_000904 [Malassezia vespertilionis]|uniref:Uncharacterized protein n=1 Tax=Malassezia vespertilionis TaxID=2020962 RepID=A0A2N1JE02_9BASI|nr:uncharacterized protein MVES1_000904 [Malassezia vespertilionis]PKI84775.1 hypothetical protein MVES_000852 [Malassezia vespertilionis]WFD05574.1 hypothetical protein MVES1_000904 [Malassezia vespertilionis]